MRHSAFAAVVFALFLSLSGDAWAHRVNVFAFVDGDEIQVECGFSKTRKVVNGGLEITDAETGETLLRGTTDEQGRFRFRPSEEFLSTGRGLNIRLFAGVGHQNDWQISPEELRTLSPSGAGAAPASPPGKDGATVRRPSGPAGEKQALSLSSVDMAGLEAMIGRIVEEKLVPVRQAMEQRRDDEPGLRDIVGGIGWILGLLGLAAYMKYRKHRH